MAATLALGTSGCVGACTTIGYADSSDIAIAFDKSPLPSDDVLACLGRDCEPSALEGSGDSWRIPQTEPFIDGPLTDPVVRIVVVDAAGAQILDVTATIPIESERTGFFGECPGPFQYQPVEVQVPAH